VQDGGHPAGDGPDPAARGHGDPPGRRRDPAQGAADGQGDAVEDADGEPRGQPQHPREGALRRQAVLDRRRRGIGVGGAEEHGQLSGRQGFRGLKW
jgi:hypothetical protein